MLIILNQKCLGPYMVCNNASRKSTNQPCKQLSSLHLDLTLRGILPLNLEFGASMLAMRL